MIRTTLMMLRNFMAAECFDLQMKEFEIIRSTGQIPGESELRAEAARAAGVPVGRIAAVRVLKRSVDARFGTRWRFRVAAWLEGEAVDEYRIPEYRDVNGAPEVIVVGAGPAGLFAALRLLQLGLKPVILERGRNVRDRRRDVAALSRTGMVDPDSNYCYGEGGAGAFSDGKLYTRSSKRGDNRDVLWQFVRFGAPESILIDSHPHLGSDRLPQIVLNMRECIESHGGVYRFGARVTSIARTRDGFEVRTSSADRFVASAVILATGHSARDVYEMVVDAGGCLQAKGFALGVRVEHPQEVIDRSRRNHPSPAEYSFVEQEDGRGVFSFCMCPGGSLVPSSTMPGTVVLNGMSNAARSGRYANAGVVVQIEPGDIAGADPMRLMDFQQDVERRMYEFCRSAGAPNPMAAPAQRMTDFCRGRLSETLPASTYPPGVVSAPLHELLPAMVAERLRKVFPRVPLPGYYTGAALLLGVESRTSSPVRILRDPDTLEALSLSGVFPAGEGAGYSGGIVSSAIDGIRCADAASRYVSDNQTS